MQKTQYFFSPQTQQTNRKNEYKFVLETHNFEVQTNVYSFEYKSVPKINSGNVFCMKKNNIYLLKLFFWAQGENSPKIGNHPMFFE